MSEVILSRWIPVKERNPTERGAYLVYDPSWPEPVRICRYGTSVKWDNGRNRMRPPDARITHWQPLPEPPK